MQREGTINGAEAQSAFREHQDRMFFRLLIKGFIFSTKYLPVWALRLFGFPFIVFFMAYNYKNTISIMKNLRKIEPKDSSLKIFLKAFSLFKNYAYYLIDLLYISHDGERFKEYKIKETGRENMLSALESKRGVILLTTHIGNWEMGGPMAKRYFGKRLNLVYSPDSQYFLESQRKRIRKMGEVNEIALSEGGFSSLKILRILQAKEAIALQGDRLTFDSGVVVEFFGKDAIFPKGQVKLASLTGALILPVFIPITGYKSYEIIVSEPISVEPSLELKENLSKIIKVFEIYIKRYSTQWFTFMPFWVEDRGDS